MTISSILKQAVCRLVAASLILMSFAPSAHAVDINYDADTDVVVNSVRLTILANSKASRLSIGTTLTVDVSAGSNFFLVSRDGTALPNTVSINNENQAALEQSCTQNAQGQSTENVLSIQGATAGTMRVTITPTVGTKCQKAGGGASVGSSGGGGVVSTGTTSTGTLPVASTIIPGVTPTAPKAPVATTPSTGTAAPAGETSAVVPLAPSLPAVVATPVEIKEQASDTAANAIDVVDRALEALAPAMSATAAPGASGEPSPAATPAASAAPIQVNVSQAAVTIAEKFVPPDATPRERAVMQVVIDNPPAAVEAKGKGEWAGSLNSTRIANNGEIPTEPVKLKKFVENAALVLNGRFPIADFKNPSLEEKMAGLLETTYKRELNPGEEVKEEIADRNAVVIASYGLRQQKRSAKAERAAAKVVDKTLVKSKKVKKNTGEYWNLVNAVAYSGAKR